MTTSGIGDFSWSSTARYLTREERLRAVKAAVACVQGRVPLVVGVGALRTDEVQCLGGEAETAGADGLLMAPVSYTPLTADEAFEHYRAVTAASGLPMCVYNNPSTTRFTFGLDLLKRLSRLPTIQAVKMPLPMDGNYAGEIAALHGRTGLAAGSSGDWGAADALLAGADAFYSVIGGTLPGSVVALLRAAQAGDAEGAHRMNAALAPLREIFKAFGSLRVMCVLLDLLGLGRAELPKPLLPLEGDAREQVLTAAEPLWDVP